MHHAPRRWSRRNHRVLGLVDISARCCKQLNNRVLCSAPTTCFRYVLQVLRGCTQQSLLPQEVEVGSCCSLV